MRSACAVCSVAVALCLVVCVSASAKVNQAVAEKAVGDAKAAVNAVCARAETQFENATSVLNKVESSNSEATQTSSEAAEAAKGNPTAVEIAQQIKSLSDAVAASYSDTKEKLKTVVSSFTPLLEEAKGLEGKSTIEVEAKGDSKDDFTETNEKAKTLKGEAEALDTKITNALQKMDEPYSKAIDMEQNAKEAQRKNSHVSTIVAVAKIKSIMGEADRIMQTIQTKKTEFNGIVEEMKKLKATAPSGSIESIDKLYKKAEAELTKATSALEKATTANGAINQQKELAEAALKNFEKTEIDLETAKQEANKAKTYIRTAEDNVLLLKSEVQPAETSATNAKGLKEEMEQALLNAKKKPNTEQGKETTEANLSVADGTDPHQKDTTIQPTISVPLLVALIASAVLQ